MSDEKTTPLTEEECPVNPTAEQPEEQEAAAAETAESAAEEKAKKKRECKKDSKKLAEQVTALTDELARAEQKLAEARDAHLRTLAEYENFRKRSQREKDEVYPIATANAITQFLPALDAFDRGMAAPCTDEAFQTGMGMVQNQMVAALEKLGCEKFGAPGDVFDPNIHNAVMHVEDDSVADSTVVEVFQPGYRIGEKIVRFAMVKVAN
ncbi:MAG: nucleotide exchange factor GrpE [Clostridia bacterium]|nr:nucleotide exchange factor GrpE [Clostridia bacterium]